MLGHVQAITLCCPSLQMLMLGGISVADTTSSTSAEDLMKELQLQDVDDGSSLLSAATAAVHAVSEAHPDSQLAKLLRVQAFAMQLCLTAVQLPLLRVIEVTSMARGIIASVKLFLKEHVGPSWSLVLCSVLTSVFGTSCSGNFCRSLI